MARSIQPILRRAAVYAVCLLLLAAASLKLWSVLSPGEAVWLTRSERAFNAALAGFELLLAAWLITGRMPRLAWATTLATFLAFAGVAATKVAAGEASCGCFGLLIIDPRWTLALDLVVVAALAWAGPVVGRAGRHAALERDDRDARSAGSDTADTRQRFRPSSAATL